MYRIVTLEDSIRVPPRFLGDNKEESIKKSLQGTKEGTFENDVGIILSVTKIGKTGEGRIIPGDGAVYYPTQFEVLAFNPGMHEVVEGEVIEIVEFGAFIRLGPIDGLVHVSQLANDFMSYSKEGVLQGKESGKVLKVGDRVRARIVSISQKQTQSAKLGLTMRQPGLGKVEWIRQEEKKIEKKGDTKKGEAK